ncbi:hypothetical protein ACS86_17770 [Vibrio alginolyticus]|nr:hypothetical protein ACS86_17770 [Vibrio alginolyticus]
MSLTKTCDVRGIRFSSQSIQTLERINSRVDLGNLLAGALSSSPLLEIFLKPNSAANYAQDIYGYQWEEFGQAMGSVNTILKYRVWEEAVTAASYTSGEEREFWKCVIQLTR